MDILSNGKDKSITLADGKTYMLSPLNLNLMADIEEEFDCNFEEVSKKFFDKKSKRFVIMRKLLYIFLKKNHPELKIEDVGNLVTRNNLAEVSQAIVDVWLGK